MGAGEVSIASIGRGLGVTLAAVGLTGAPAGVAFERVASPPR